jgi:hypothetical protein
MGLTPSFEIPKIKSKFKPKLKVKLLPLAKLG